MAEKALKLNLFAWEGTDKRGNRVKGESRGTNPTLVKAELRKQGIVPLKVKKKSALTGAGKGKAITPKDIAIFSRQLATMMSSGVPLVQAFDIIGKGHENPKMQQLVMTVKADIEGGSNLADSLRKHPLYFDDLVCNLVEAGEAAGVLDTLLDKIATYKEKTEALKAKIKKALFRRNHDQGRHRPLCAHPVDHVRRWRAPGRGPGIGLGRHRQHRLCRCGAAHA